MNVRIKKLISIFGSLFLLQGCPIGSETVSPPPTEQFSLNDNGEATEIFEGSYSWWSHPTTQVLSPDQLVFTGVSPYGHRESLQWVSVFDKGLNELIRYNLGWGRYGLDEHNTPAVLAIGDGKLLSAYTGHNYIENGNGKVFYRFIDHDARTLSDEAELSFREPVTYVQLHMLENGCIAVVTRLRSALWQLTQSCDRGRSWRRPSDLLNKGYMLSEANTGKLHVFLAQHPTLKEASSIYYDVIEEVELQYDSLVGNPMGGLNRAPTNIVYQAPDNRRIRLLDSTAGDVNIALFAEFEPTIHSLSGATWRLVIAWSSGDSWQSAYLTGELSGVLGEESETPTSYVLGASITNKAELKLDGSRVKVVLAHRAIDGVYLTSLLEYEPRSGYLHESAVIYESREILSRPVLINGMLLVQKSSFWQSYENYRTKLILKSL